MSPPRTSTARRSPTGVARIRDRKLEHLKLALDEQMQLGQRYFDDYVFEHCAFPEIDFDEIDTAVEFLGARLSAPLIVSCMTGGNDEAARINKNLAEGAEEARVAVGVGSQRRAIEDESTAASFQIRPFAPSVPVLANLGAVQLNYGFGAAECRRAVEMIDADALVFHLNALQEALQPEGQRNFSGLLDQVGAIARGLEVPVVVKEIGCGIGARTARELLARGIRIVDTAGVGGTTWARIEAARAGDPSLGEVFADWGIPTPRAIRELAGIEGLTVIGSGGLRNGLDMAKAIALGADLTAMAFPFLRAASESAEAVAKTVQHATHQLKIAMFCVGARTLADLRRARLLHGGSPIEAPLVVTREGHA